MIGVLVTFTQTDKFDRSSLARIADESRATFEGMPGLRFKSFTLEDDGLQARNFYVDGERGQLRSTFRAARIVGQLPAAASRMAAAKRSG